MANLKITSKQYKALVKTARKAGGDENQSHWRSRLQAATDGAAKAAAKPALKRSAR